MKEFVYATLHPLLHVNATNMLILVRKIKKSGQPNQRLGVDHPMPSLFC